MNEETSPTADPKDSLALKLTEPEVSTDKPWGDDVLGRKEIAARLTNLISNQSLPLTISIHGAWGTGKTFMLKRWQKDLESQKFRAIYDNAWEDDFCDDPLLSIIGQMWDYFERDKGDKLKQLVKSVKEQAGKLVWANIKSVISNKTGLTFEIPQSDQTKSDLIDVYLDQTRTRTELKEQLKEMAAEVNEESGQPLVFIIDELDRCRPTFAIELLERVKHIFDVPNMVFALGINRDELCKALSSVYGDIDTDVYLRRFFDLEFNLPEVDSRQFTINLIEQMGLADVFQSLAESSRNEVHVHDYDNYVRVFPRLWTALELSLRDMDYGIRLLALLAMNVKPNAYTHPFLLSILIAVRFKQPATYKKLVKGTFRTSEVIDFVEEELARGLVDEDLSRYLDRIEGFLHCAEDAGNIQNIRGAVAYEELQEVQYGNFDANFSVISRRARSQIEGRASRILQAIEAGRSLNVEPMVFSHLASLIDMYQPSMRSLEQ